jgi:hypothetical protein
MFLLIKVLLGENFKMFKTRYFDRINLFVEGGRFVAYINGALGNRLGSLISRQAGQVVEIRADQVFL